MRVLIPGVDIIKVETGDLTFHLTPLTFAQRSEVNGELQKVAGQLIRNSFEMAGLAVRYALRQVDGLKTHNGTAWKIEHEAKSGKVNDASLDVLASIPDHSHVLFDSCVTLSSTGPFKELKDGNGKVVEGVKVILPGDDEKN